MEPFSKCIHRNLKTATRFEILNYFESSDNTKKAYIFYNFIASNTWKYLHTGGIRGPFNMRHSIVCHWTKSRKQLSKWDEPAYWMGCLKEEVSISSMERVALIGGAINSLFRSIDLVYCLLPYLVPEGAQFFYSSSEWFLAIRWNNLGFLKDVLLFCWKSWSPRHRGIM